MRRFLSILLLILVGLSPIGIVDRSSAAQEDPSLEQRLDDCPLGGSKDTDSAGQPGQWWAAVCRPIPILGARTPAPLMQGYLVKFAEAYGATRPQTNVPEEGFEVEPEFMAVIVIEGFFALDLRDEPQQSIVVSPADGLIQGLRWLGPEKVEPPFYDLINTETGIVCEPSDPGDPSDPNCETMCDPNCTVDPGEAVLLKEGDVAVAKAGTLCLWCLLGRNEIQDPNDHLNGDDHARENLEPGLLSVFALLAAPGNPESFSWIRDWDRVQEEDPESRTDEPTSLAWAFSPHSTRCGGG